ncbi:hypothetical protein E1B28_005386 [Marasmius oreades]|uniref:Wax synthase domain-containing protein n=1 Tax=Marasmius oreades TaxID=181124 RepID=A0A9P7S4Y9_9AGAR|nr:uncharacterized protein E1B28_005386 [Marasmius oreades]KAG7094558.1 hypothetical protein E1B28_005386 [Marasmius oreades]
MNYALASWFISYLLNAFTWLFLEEVPHKFNVPRVGPDAPFTTRLQEGIRLMSSPRGIGWSHEPTHALRPSPHPSTTRTQFVVRQLFHALVYLSALSLIGSTYIQQQSCFKYGGPSAGDPMYGLTRRSLNVIAFGVCAVSLLSMLYCVVTATVVAFRMATPQECPPFFGSPVHSSTLRGFWGKTWHQLLRSVVSPYGRSLAGGVLRFQQGSIPYSLIQCYTAFFITGLLHEISDTMTRQPEDRTLGFGSSLTFFLLQPVGITIESVVIYIYQSQFRGGSKSWEKFVDFVWVASWLVWCGPIFIDAIVSSRLTDYEN